jgi:hypothetical protein
VHTITVIAIAAAAAAGIIAGTLLLIIPVTSMTAPENERQELVAGKEVTNHSGYRQVNVTVNGVKLVADVAATNDQRTKGLSVKDTLNENEAMLFVFSKAREHSFWMKDMKFPIDIIWVSEYHEVVYIEHSLEPCEPDASCPTYKPDGNSLYVLETVAGFAQKHNITENAFVDFQLDE